jgi:hypothetical protein
MVAAPVMTFKNYLPMEEKPPEVIGRGPIASRYQVLAAPPFLLPYSLQDFPSLLAAHFMSNPTSRLIVGILCYPVVPTTTAGFNEAALVSFMTSPTPARPSIVIQFTAATIPTTELLGLFTVIAHFTSDYATMYCRHSAYCHLFA